MTHRTKPLLFAVIAATSLAVPVAAHGEIITGPVTVRLELLADLGSSNAPNTLTHAGDATNRLFIVGQAGRIRLIKNGSLVTEPFLDIPAAGGSGFTLSTGGERGLLGLAFHPNFAQPGGTPGSGKFYTYTSETGRDASSDPITPDFSHPELPNVANHHSVVREWTVDPANPDQVDATTPSRVVMRINQPQGNHNGGALAFGHDHNLYIALGDGGGSNDQFGGINNNADGHTNTTGNSQDTSNVLGSILRVDPLGDTSANGQYAVPGDNPFVGKAGVDEIYAYGLRNPFRISFDRLTGELYAGDVGQGAREEVDRIVNGGNYGWVNFEGTRVNRTGGPDFEDTVAPIAEYNRSEGISVIGGFVYRGSAIPQLQGKYVFGDYQGPANVGRLFYLDLPTGDIRELQLDAASLSVNARLHGFGEDFHGELYVLLSNGDVLAIVPEPAAMSLLTLGALAMIRRPRRG